MNFEGMGEQWRLRSREGGGGRRWRHSGIVLGASPVLPPTGVRLGGSTLVNPTSAVWTLDAIVTGFIIRCFEMMQ